MVYKYTFLKPYQMLIFLFADLSLPLRLKKRLSKLFKEQLPFGKLEMVFGSTQRMSSCFRFKNAIPRSLLSGVIYEYNCPRRNSRYIVSTYRYWEKRLKEHLHILSLMGKPLKGL